MPNIGNNEGKDVIFCLVFHHRLVVNIGLISLETCTMDEYLCKEEMTVCMDGTAACDGLPQCTDGSDEVFCGRNKPTFSSQNDAEYPSLNAISLGNTQLQFVSRRMES